MTEPSCSWTTRSKLLDWASRRKSGTAATSGAGSVRPGYPGTSSRPSTSGAEAFDEGGRRGQPHERDLRLWKCAPECAQRGDGAQQVAEVAGAQDRDAHCRNNADRRAATRSLRSARDPFGDRLGRPHAVRPARRRVKGFEATELGAIAIRAALERIELAPGSPST